MTVLDELSHDPFDDDLAKQLAARAPRRWATRSTVVLAGLVLVVAGFVAGVQVQKHYGTTSTSAGQQDAGSGQQGATGTRGGQAQGAAPGGANASQAAAGGQGASGANKITGTVKMVDGTTVYIQTSDGQTIVVKTADGTAVQVSQTGSLKDVTPGATVTVEGQRTGNSVSATRITRQ